MEIEKSSSVLKEPHQVIIQYDSQTFPIENTIVTIKKRLNEHTIASVKGTMQQEVYEKYIIMTTARTNLEIHFTGLKKTIMFTGIIQNIEVETKGIEKNANFDVIIEAISYSYLCDIKKIKRSFQDISMSYTDLLTTVMSNYDNGDAQNIAAKDRILKQFTMQYMESDWEFIKRMASRFYAPLVVDHFMKRPRIYFGVNLGTSAVEIKNAKYRLAKYVDKYLDTTLNYTNEIFEADYMNYEITTQGSDTQSFELGQMVLYKDVEFYVMAATAYIKDHVLHHNYILSSKRGFFMPSIFNNQTSGLSVKGTVIKVNQNLLKVHLDIDAKQDIPTAYEFHYGTFYSTFYCMPEVGDRVNTHFPTNDEGDGIVINSIKQGSGDNFARVRSNDKEISAAAPSKYDYKTMADDEKIKILTTEAGKMVILDDRNGTVSIVCNDGTYIQLSDEDGILIDTNLTVAITSDTNISLIAKDTVYMHGQEKITLSCGEKEKCFVSMDPTNLVLYGKDIHLNRIT